MSYYKSKSRSRWTDPSAHAKSGIACIGSSEVYSIHKHLDLSHVTVSKENSEEEIINLEDEKINSQEEIKESICINEKQRNNIIFHDEVSHEPDHPEEEIESLKNHVFSLQESKKELEMQLLFYQGLKEQQSTVKDLQTLVEEKTSQMELLGKTIESLIGSENCQLEKLATERAMLKAEMDLARMKMKETKKQIHKSWRKKKDAMIKLCQQVAAQRSRIAQMLKREGDMNRIIEGLHGESKELREANLGLMNDRSELMRKMDSITEGMTIEKEATEKALEEANRLRIANAELSNQLEMYREDSQKDIQEQLYLRWINTCLRYELQKRNRSRENSGIKDENGEKILVDLGADESKCNSDDMDSSSVTEAEPIDSSGDLGSKKLTKEAKPKLLYRIRKWVDPYESMKEINNEVCKSDSVDGRMNKSSSNAHAKRIVSFCGKMDYVGDIRVLPRTRSMLVKATLCRETPTIRSR